MINLTRARWAIFLAGFVAGSLLMSATGTYIALAHPHFTTRVEAKLRSLLTAHQESSAPIAAPGDVQVVVDDTASGYAISPLIYGVAFASTGVLQQLGATVDRWGGNTSSRYNWVVGDAWAAGRDWEFRNTATDWSGAAADKFVLQSQGAGAAPLLTVPTIGYVAKNNDNNVRSVGVPDQGGAPVNSAGAIAGYDPTHNRSVTSVPSYPSKDAPSIAQPAPGSSVVYEDEWIKHLVDRFGSNGVRFFTMDNEPDLWSVTHTDVHPAAMSYQSMLDTFEQYSTAVKAVDPSALVLGPDVSGWTGYMFSALDQGSDNYATHADRAAHGNQEFLAWWLAQVAKADRARGSRSLDLLDVHYYPQANNVFGDASDPATQALRIRSTRSLWDPTYSDESWIGQPVMLIPRLKSWVQKNYPGTGIAITEYNWGGEKDASGAVALATVLGVFGREGVDLATYWAYPPPNSPAGAAFRLYRNADGKGAKFGDIELPVSSTRSGLVAFAARHSDRHEVDVILINQSAAGAASINLKLKSGAGSPADEFKVLAGSSVIEHTAGVSLSSVDVPPMSIVMVRIPTA